MILCRRYLWQLGLLIEYTLLPSSPVRVRSVAIRGDISSPTWMLIQPVTRFLALTRT